MVLVDSADLCYAEIPLDEHAILLGKGNIGKSSILNSLRLFLLPEVNFSKCESKFAFRTADKNSYYSKDQSFQHYFPSASSFLILEVENFTGSHCQILCRGTGYEYKRLFVPLPYHQIRDLFWSCNEDEDGIGQAVEGLTFSSVREKLKKRTPDTLIVSDSNKLQKMLYANDLLNNSETRYSLFPLVEQDISKVNSLRALFLLLFDMNSNSSAMTKAIADIIEADKKSSNDVLNFNIDDFLKKHEQLEQENEQLTVIKNKEIEFSHLKIKFYEYTQLSESDKKYANFADNLSREKEQTQKDKKTIDDQIRPLLGEIKKFEIASESANKKLIEINAKIETKNTDFECAQRDFSKGRQIWQQFYTSLTINDAQESAKQEYLAQETHLNALNNEIEAQNQRNEFEKSIKSYKEKIRKLEESSRNRQFILAEQLMKPVTDILASVNKKLIQANPNKALKADDIKTINQFASLFRDSESGFDWYDISFEKRSTDIFDDLEKQVIDLREKLKNDENALSRLQQANNSLHRQKDIEKLENKLEDLRLKIESLKKYPVAEANMETLKVQLENMHIDKKNIEAEKTFSQNALIDKNKQHTDLKPKQDFLDKKLASFIELEERCKVLTGRYKRLRDVESNTSYPYQQVSISADILNKIESELSHFDELRNQIIRGLHNFIYENIIDDEYGIRVDAPTARSIKNTFKKLQEVFNELPQKRSILNEQTLTHNQSVAQYTNVLTSHERYIEAFKNQLNRDFQSITVNDLEKIEVNIEIDRRFRNLVAEINKADFHSNESLTARFYERLQVFVSSFFNEKDGSRLTMDKVVTGLSYRIKKKGSEAWQTKKQSNSTTALINLELAQLLLRRIKKSGCTVTFPLVHDELADINIDQFDWLLPHLNKQGFRLFSAATYSASSELIYKIGNYHEIGSMKTARSYSADRTIVYLGGAEKFLKTEEARKMDVIFAEQPEIIFPDN